MNDFNLATEDKAELKAYAKNNLDLGLPMTMSAETMRQKILAKCEELQIEAPTAVVLTKRDKVKKDVKAITITIAKTKDAGGSEPVFVGVQGVGYYIPRGIPVKVSPAIVEVLKNAVADDVTQEGDSALMHNDVQVIPYTVHSAAA